MVQAKYCSANVLFSRETDEFNTPVCLCNILRNWLFALKWHFGYSSIFKDTMSHRSEIFTVGRAPIKHSITSIIIRLIVDLISSILFWNTVWNILGHPVNIPYQKSVETYHFWTCAWKLHFFYIPLLAIDHFLENQPLIDPGWSLHDLWSQQCILLWSGVLLIKIGTGYFSGNFLLANSRVFLRKFPSG